ncbi:hypothetical protein BU24DRAFT_497511 [Aaosphaeria arxii CBS 175.79]|uniref:Uncharacterized protein n=1 Tax=Aaosphaeria arxii CBS 175.79 TaxID=1450172 RepID=A0A6A5X7P2_9PLEO|nr:uncharacterized protein BU24DRAFT_497511 [Aaosphaeria arxii CBS 175.79]KAF2008909.1 hypothetical protein BU24DRAFT_497511 [Aaosphaeria arxii CBS 175.79]
MKVKQIYLLREGQTADNYFDPYTGEWGDPATPTRRFADKSLSEAAIQQIRGTARALSRLKLERVFVAPHWQCVDTMSRILPHLNVADPHSGLMSVEYGLSAWEDPFYFPPGVKSKSGNALHPTAIGVFASNFSNIDTTYRSAWSHSPPTWDAGLWRRDVEDNLIPPTNTVSDPDEWESMPTFLLRIKVFLDQITRYRHARRRAILICATAPALLAIATLLKHWHSLPSYDYDSPANIDVYRAWMTKSLKKFRRLMKGPTYWREFRTGNLYITRYDRTLLRNWRLAIDGRRRHISRKIDQGNEWYMPVDARWQLRLVPDIREYEKHPIGCIYNSVHDFALQTTGEVFETYLALRRHFGSNPYHVPWYMYIGLWFCHLTMWSLALYKIVHTVALTIEDWTWVYTPMMASTVQFMLFMFPPLLAA